MPQEIYAIEKEVNAPTIITEDGTPTIDNSELRKIANDALDAAKYAFVSVAANPGRAVPPESLNEALKEGLDSLPTTDKERIGQKAAHLAGVDTEVRTMLFGRYGKLDSQAFAGLDLDQAEAQVDPLAIDSKLLGVKPPEIKVPLAAVQQTSDGLLIPNAALPGDVDTVRARVEQAYQQSVESQVFNVERLEDIWGPLPTVVEPLDTEISRAGGSQLQAAAAAYNLGFYITRIKCVDETNPEWPGHDEIKLGGISIDETGDTKKISSRFIGGGFDDGDQKLYTPHWRYHNFNLREGKHWPKAYAIDLFLAEEDHGGFNEFLDKVWKKVEVQVKKEIEKAVRGILDQYVGPAIAQAIAKIAAWVAEKFIEWIIEGFKDDLFPVYSARVTVPSYGARWYYPNGRWGSPVSPRKQAHFYGHGGHYYVEYYWRLY